MQETKSIDGILDYETKLKKISYVSNSAQDWHFVFFCTFICLLWMTGVPGIIVIAWVFVMQFTYEVSCWKKYSQNPWIYLVLVPFLVVIFVSYKYLTFFVLYLRFYLTLRLLKSKNPSSPFCIKLSLRVSHWYM